MRGAQSSYECFQPISDLSLNIFAFVPRKKHVILTRTEDIFRSIKRFFSVNFNEQNVCSHPCLTIVNIVKQNLIF